MSTLKKKTDRVILDDIIKQLETNPTDFGMRSHASYIDKDRLIKVIASVKWIVVTYSNYIDGYLEGEYDFYEDWDDLQVEASIDGEFVEIDEDYLNEHLKTHD